MATSLSEILSALQNGVAAMNQITSQLALTFPQYGVVVSSAIATTNSTITFGSSQAAGFLAVTTSSGAAYYIPIYR